MMRIGFKGFLTIVLSFVAAIMLMLLPLPEWVSWYEPQWILLVLLFWLITFPQKINMGTAWCIGLLMDALNGSLLGEHAFAVTAVAYVALVNYRKIKVAPMITQSVFIFGLVFFYQMIIFIIQGLIGQMPMSMDYWLSSVTSMLFWPWINVICYEYSGANRVSLGE